MNCKPCEREVSRAAFGSQSITFICNRRRNPYPKGGLIPGEKKDLGRDKRWISTEMLVVVSEDISSGAFLFNVFCH